MADLRFPIGEFVTPGELSAGQRSEAIGRIEAAPEELRQAVETLTEAQLDTPYRPGGWTVRQVVHHLADSHTNSYVRLKLALTESEPTIRPYDEKLWAELPDARGPVEMSLRLLDALHGRWVYLFRRIPDDGWRRPFRHPELGSMLVDDLLAFYAWHGRHHVAHITSLRRREGW